MDKKFTQEQQELLRDALNRAKAHSKKMREDRYNRLWKEVKFPCNLYDTISRLSKYEIDTIRKTYNFKGLSSLNKSELSMQLSALIPLKFDKIIYALDQTRYDLIKGIIHNSGIIPYMNMDVDLIETFREYSIIFPGMNNGEKVLFMPTELIEEFSRIDGVAVGRIVQRNTEWIRLTLGMLHYYGVMETGVIKKRIEELTNQKIDILEFMNVINMACDFYGQARYSIYGYHNSLILNPKEIVGEHRNRPDIDYYPFTLKQLLKASDEFYVDKTPELNRFTSFLLRNYEFSDDEIDEIALQVTTIINVDLKSTAIMEYLQSIIEIPSLEFLQELTMLIMDLHNGTRQWALKGYSPNEIAQKSKTLNPLLTENLKKSSEESKVINIQTRKKIGRNDPCPCGSGKKYKRCCGK